MKLDAALLEGFTAAFLRKRFDDAVATPEFHREMWKLCCSDAPHVGIAAPRNHAKAQPLTCKVLTPDGWKRIGDLSVGDRVIGRHGITSVTALHPISELPVYEVTARDGRKTKCNAEHLWTVLCSSNSPMEITKPLKEILKNWKADRANGYTEYRYCIPTPDPVEFPEKELEVSPYTLGVWLGDGHSAGGRITSADPEIIEMLDCAHTKSAHKYVWGTVGLQKRLRLIGVLNNKHIPQKYLYGSVEQRLALLQGLMDTDGTVHCQGKIGYFCNTNMNLIDGVVHLTRSLGGVAVKYPQVTKCNGKYFDSWRVSVKLPLGMVPFRLSRKASKWKSCKSNYNYIVGIEPAGMEMCRCISVAAKDGLYVTDDYLVTHNSTAITHAFGLAASLFGFRDYILIVSDTEGQGVKFLGDIKMELTENEMLAREFGVELPLIKDTETEIIFKCAAGMVNYTVRGAEQKVRGLKWRGKRPNLVIVDDLENDELVLNKERRDKLRSWFLTALIPCGSKRCLFRMVGTVLHLDSVLNRVLEDKTWVTRRYAAHGPEYTNVLWAAKYSADELRAIRARFSAQGKPEKYSQEYLNMPIDEETAFYRREWFHMQSPMEARSRKRVFASVDLAVSQKESADFTAIVVAGVDAEGLVHILDVQRGRFDSLETVERLFTVQSTFSPDLLIVEKGPLHKAFLPFLNDEMYKRQKYLNIHSIPSTKDKMSRARAMQGKMRLGAVRFADGDWLGDLIEEMTRFPRAAHDDMVDAMSLIGQALDEMPSAQTEREAEDEEYAMIRHEQPTGRSEVCGY